MRRLMRRVGGVGVGLVGALLLGPWAMTQESRAQTPEAPAPPPAAMPADLKQELEAVERAFDTQLHNAQLQRLKAIEALVARHESTDAGTLTEIMLEHAIADNLFQEAQPAARRVIELGEKTTAKAALLARIVDIVATIDRGDYPEFATTLKQAIAARPADAKADAATVISLLEVAYYQLVTRRQFEVATRAFEAARAVAQAPAVQSYLDQRLNRLRMVGQPAPALVGPTIDGNQFDLAASRGKVVVIVFWASWHIANAEQIEGLVELSRQFEDQGLQMVSVNLDTAQADGGELETLLPNIKRFMLDYNLSWPTLVNGEGEADYAAAFHVTDLPATVLIDRQGQVIGIDLGVSELYQVLPSLLAR